jgi:hypothetical protein
MNSQNSVSIRAKKTAQQNYTANLPIETLGFPGLSLAALGFQVRRVWWLSRVALGLPVLLLALLLRPDSKEAMAVRLQEVRLLVMAWERVGRRFRRQQPKWNKHALEPTLIVGKVQVPCAFQLCC